MITLTKNSVRALVAACALAVSSAGALAAEGGHHYTKQDWTFSGPFGKFDKAQLQRGFQVYKEVCSSCHSLKYIAFRNLGDEGGPGFSEDEIKALAAEYEVQDGPDSDGEMFMRPGKPFDRIPSPFPNDEAAKASNGGALPPDLSLIAKARAGDIGPDTGITLLNDMIRMVWHTVTTYQEYGPDYIYALLTGYEETPAELEEEIGALNYNPAFISGNKLAMAPPLFDELVEYSDGTKMTTEQYAKDVSAFLMWAAEPKLEERKHVGINALIFLVVFAGLMFFTKRKLWSNVDH
ncbi:ubiquinol-cytochrome c reductase cytochrome c1 subunit [Cohaesibacter sp. ES.047]|uniref:cytochrome c1 n=1 Tax=Cohaesibacter sp. ES.047 TaxID=1798205 RepID=UPI000BB7E191|nr:cytochrome c1 [Cohaesibacter sp. ES.047]SNY91489.1 ubiquinol-cytochrome c reductase cytochrome c1 subunit [Cohaesibacter sp. ES.047]